ncbi:MAG: hypothetical protein WCH43_15740 [Verrucomicrobiota bacterium]
MNKPTSNYAEHRVRGSVLLLVLWALLLLSGVVFAWVKTINQDISIIHQANSGLDARALAHSGAWIALHPLVSNQTPLLDGTFGPTRGYHVKLTGEGGKLNLNVLLQMILAGNGQNQRLLLENYLTRRGLSQQERAILIDSLLDWVQPGNTRHLNGMQDSATYKNAHRPFLTLDEVEKVNGSGPLVSKPDWKNDFTLYTQHGKIDLLTASLPVLQSIPGIGDARAIQFLNIRQGPDHLDGTKDDHVFKDITEVRSFLGLSETQFQQISNLVAIQDSTYHILSEGRSGDVKRQLEVIAQKSGASPVILYWKEI